MNGYGRLIDATFSNFEKLLRWLYPGGLLFILLSFCTEPICFIFNGTCPKQIAIIIIFGFIAYIIQGGFISFPITWACEKLFKFLLPFWSGFIEGEAKRAESHYECSELPNLRAHLNYKWGFYHAMSLTAWLPLVFFAATNWWPIPWWVLTILFLLSIIYFAVPNKIAERLKLKTGRM